MVFIISGQYYYYCHHCHGLGSVLAQVREYKECKPGDNPLGTSWCHLSFTGSRRSPARPGALKRSGGLISLSLNFILLP